jgi:hypothetical protein
MPTPLEFPRQRVGAIQELAARLLDRRKVGTKLETLARDLLAGFHDLCLRSGLDRVLVELDQAFPAFDISDRSGLSDHETLFPALVAQLGAIDIDGGGPRNAKPPQLADCVVKALGLTLVDEADRTIALEDAVRSEVVAAMSSVVDGELGVPRIREAIIAKGRELCEERYHAAYDRLVAHLDERGQRMLKQPKVPLDAVQAVQPVLYAARNAVVGGAASTAIDRAKQVIERSDADAAARIDLPITHRLTPREVAVARACDDRVPKQPAAVVQSLLESLTELAGLAWRAPIRPVRPYAASQTFAVGDLLEHPKFGRGSVIARQAQRIEVEFADGRHTLVHTPPK